MGADVLDSLSYMSSGGSPVDLDVTLVFLVVLFISLMMFLNWAIYQPYLRLKDVRYERIQGAKAASKDMQARAEETLDDYEQKLTEVRLGAAQERKRAKESARAAEQEIVKSARVELDATLDKAHNSLESEIDKAEKDIDRLAEGLANEIVEKVLTS